MSRTEGSTCPTCGQPYGGTPKRTRKAAVIELTEAERNALTLPELDKYYQSIAHLAPRDDVRFILRVAPELERELGGLIAEGRLPTKAEARRAFDVARGRGVRKRTPAEIDAAEARMWEEHRQRKVRQAA